jgi:hypothetical protein
MIKTTATKLSVFLPRPFSGKNKKGSIFAPFF